mgnify:CR=1 FL=1
MALTKLNVRSISGDITADQLDVGQLGGRRNLIINGAMQVAQRGTSKSFAHDAINSGYLIDRFDLELQAVNDELDGTYSQVSDAPDGFSSSLKWTTGTPETTIDADENMRLEYHIEAQDLQHLKYGTSSAQSLTLSFWVKSSITGTYAISLYQADGVRMIGSTYTISTADTWQYVTLTFAGDISGTMNNDTGEGLRIIWTLASGSNFNVTDNTSWGAFVLGMFSYGHAQNGVITTASATWQITGIQLEVGSVATPFEHRSYGEELALCQRYYYNSHLDGDFSDYNGQIMVFAAGTSTFGATCTVATGREYPTTMRATPTVTLYHQDGTSGAVYVIHTGAKITGVTVFGPTSKGFLYAYKANGFNTGFAYYYGYTAEAEL